MTRNKVHMAVRTTGRRTALCGSDVRSKSGNKLPTSKEARDVTCKLCKRSMRKMRKK